MSFTQVLLCYDDPESHPFIKNDELDYLRLELGQKSMSQQKQAVPWRQMFTSVPFAAMILATVYPMFRKFLIFFMLYY